MPLWRARKVLHDRLDPNTDNRGDATYDTTQPILYKLIQSFEPGYEKAISYLLAHGANPNCGGHRYTCLNLAITRNKLRLIKRLIDAGADVNLPSASNYHPVKIAVERMNVKALRMLIKAGARPVAIDAPYFNGERGVFWLKQNKQIRSFLGIEGGANGQRRKG